MESSIKQRVDELVKLRESFLNYEESEDVFNELRNIYKDNYIPKRTNEEYLDLFLNYNVSIETRHPQERNYSHAIYTAFSTASQHVYGTTKEHCLDLVFEEVEKKKARIEMYSKLASLDSLVNSSLEIIEDKIYNYREGNMHPDSCYGISGSEILKKRQNNIECQ